MTTRQRCLAILATSVILAARLAAQVQTEGLPPLASFSLRSWPSVASCSPASAGWPGRGQAVCRGGARADGSPVLTPARDYAGSSLRSLRDGANDS